MRRNNRTSRCWQCLAACGRSLGAIGAQTARYRCRGGPQAAEVAGGAWPPVSSPRPT